MRIFYLAVFIAMAGSASAQVSVARGALNGEPARWRPTTIKTFDIQLNDPANANQVPAVQVVELDIDSEQALLNTVKGRGTKLVCYFNAGAWENYRRDKNKFPASVLGSYYDGFPDERWLDIRQISKLAPIMRARMDQCKKKGFVAIDPDNVNGYENNTGFPLTVTQQRAYNTWLMREAHARGLSIALKNTPGLATTLEKDGFDLAVTESCVADNFCSKFTPFVNAHKPVLDLEYVDEGMTLAKFCSKTKALGINAILKRSSGSVDHYRRVCP